MCGGVEVSCCREHGAAATAMRPAAMRPDTWPAVMRIATPLPVSLSDAATSSV